MDSGELVYAAFIIAVIKHEDASFEITSGIRAVDLGYGGACGGAAQCGEYELSFHVMIIF